MDRRTYAYAYLLPVALFTITSSVIVYFTHLNRKRVHSKKSKKNKNVDVGAIFGMDVGGTLSKIVYFESCEISDTTATDSKGIVRTKSSSNFEVETKLEGPDHQKALRQLYDYLDEDHTNANRDERLSFYSSMLGGRLHFLHFETRQMASSINILSSTSVTENIRTIGCTGGGAHKYDKEFSEQLGIRIEHHDELESLIRGMYFALATLPNECYTYRVPNEDTVASTSASNNTRGSNDTAAATSVQQNSMARKDKDYTEKTHVPFYDRKRSWSASNTPMTTSTTSSSTPSPVPSHSSHSAPNASTTTVPNQGAGTGMFPYLVVNIGTGVSVLKVTSPCTYERVSGSSLGGGTYWGLCRILTRAESYEEVLEMAERGDPTQVDMLVRDIYGGNYDEGSSTLDGNMVASSFGKMVMSNSAKNVNQEDIAIALLMMITNNIGQCAYLNAQLHKCPKIFFIGNFLRQNPISCRRLSFAINFWSKGKTEALFLEHEGYFGALGTFLASAFRSAVDIEQFIGLRGGPFSNESSSRLKPHHFPDVDVAQVDEVVQRRSRFLSGPIAKLIRSSLRGMGEQLSVIVRSYNDNNTNNNSGRRSGKRSASRVTTPRLDDTGASGDSDDSNVPAVVPSKPSRRSTVSFGSSSPLSPKPSIVGLDKHATTATEGKDSSSATACVFHEPGSGVDEYRGKRERRYTSTGEMYFATSSPSSATRNRRCSLGDASDLQDAMQQDQLSRYACIEGYDPDDTTTMGSNVGYYSLSTTPTCGPAVSPIVAKRRSMSCDGAADNS